MIPWIIGPARVGRHAGSAITRMNPRSNPLFAPYLPLLWRLALAAALVLAELVLRATPREGNPLVASGPLLRSLYCFLMAWPAALVILAVAEGSAATREAARRFAGSPLHFGWLAVHLVLVLPTAWPQVLEPVLGNSGGGAIWKYLPHVVAPFALLALLRALAPSGHWQSLIRSTGRLPFNALLIAAAAALMIPAAQFMWRPATLVTFALVRAQLLPFFPELVVIPERSILATEQLEVSVAEVCSGLEGVGLMLAFCAGWLWHLRREFRFPRAFLIVPVAVLVVFLLNSLRISLLFAIAELGYVQVAMAGFHSQAGWIFFLAVAFLVAVVSRRIRWWQVQGPELDSRAALDVSDANPVAPFLMPLLAILATGMLVGAISAGFETFYFLRLIACLVVLMIYRRAYHEMDWRFGWRGITGGVIVFGIWIGAAQWLVDPAAMPEQLAAMSPVARGLWLATRVLGTAITVPIAEELAFRGFLLRRFTGANFKAIRLQDTTWLALLLSSVLFGITHGSFWAPGIAAGLVYGLLARTTGRIGEAVIAHATTNSLLVVAVLFGGQWQLW